MSQLSQEWLILQSSYTTTDGSYRDAYVWAASIVEISICKFIELWEQRYTEVHGKTEDQKQSRRLEKLSIEIRQLYTLRD